MEWTSTIGAVGIIGVSIFCVLRCLRASDEPLILRLPSAARQAVTEKPVTESAPRRTVQLAETRLESEMISLDEGEPLEGSSLSPLEYADEGVPLVRERCVAEEYKGCTDLIYTPPPPAAITESALPELTPSSDPLLPVAVPALASRQVAVP